VGKGVGVADGVDASVGVIVVAWTTGAQAVTTVNMIVNSNRFILNSIKFMGLESLKEQSTAVLLDVFASTQYALLILLPFQLDSKQIFRAHLVGTA